MRISKQRCAPVATHSSTLNIFHHDEGLTFDDSVRIAAENGGRLLMASDILHFGKDRLNRLIQEVKGDRWFYLGDGPAIDRSTKRALKDGLENTLRVEVRVYRGYGHWVLGGYSCPDFGHDFHGIWICANEGLASGADAVAVIADSNPMELNRLEPLLRQ